MRLAPRLDYAASIRVQGKIRVPIGKFANVMICQFDIRQIRKIPADGTPCALIAAKLCMDRPHDAR
jgi:hypothetical protein